LLLKLTFGQRIKTIPKNPPCFEKRQITLIKGSGILKNMKAYVNVLPKKIIKRNQPQRFSKKKKLIAQRWVEPLTSMF
jgi:hypothetical protein